MTADIDFSTHWILRTKPYEGDLFIDIPCGQIWGADGQQARCRADLRSIHHHNFGSEDIDARVECFVLVPVDGRFEWRCGTNVTYEDLGLGPTVTEGWNPYDCRAELLPGWPSSPFGEPLPRADSRTATCSIRRCKYEAGCVNALGVGSCEVDGWLESRFQEIASAKPTEIAPPQPGR